MLSPRSPYSPAPIKVRLYVADEGAGIEVGSWWCLDQLYLALCQYGGLAIDRRCTTAEGRATLVIDGGCERVFLPVRVQRDALGAPCVRLAVSLEDASDALRPLWSVERTSAPGDGDIPRQQAGERASEGAAAAAVDLPEGASADFAAAGIE